MKSSNETAKIHDLLSMPVEKRILAVAEDVRSWSDVYRELPAHELARALGVPQPEQPSGDWCFTRYARIVSLEQYAEDNLPPSEMVYKLEGKVSETRFKELQPGFAALDSAPQPSFDFLADDERETLEEVIAEEQLEEDSMNGMCCLAHYSIESESGILTFEAVIEDDGHCVDLKTPYDERDGDFEDLSDCIETSW